jgi:hypothetical protein
MNFGSERLILLRVEEPSAVGAKPALGAITPVPKSPYMPPPKGEVVFPAAEVSAPNGGC